MSLLHPHRLISSLALSGSPGETDSGLSLSQKQQTAAPPCSRLLPSATLQLRAAFPCHSGSHQQRLAFRQRMESMRATTSCLLWELRFTGRSRARGGRGAGRRGGIQAKTSPHWMLGGVRGAQKQQRHTLYHRTRCWPLVSGPHSAGPPSAVLSFVSELPIAQLPWMWKDRAGRAAGRS